MCFIIFATGFFGLLSFFSQCKDKYRTKFDYQWLKHRWCAWDSNPGKQDGRRRWIHWAKAAVNDSCLVGVTNKVLQYCLARPPPWKPSLNSEASLWKKASGIFPPKKLFSNVKNAFRADQLSLDWNTIFIEIMITSNLSIATYFQLFEY